MVAENQVGLKHLLFEPMKLSPNTYGTLLGKKNVFSSKHLMKP
jgi:hypothetical protein